MEWGASAEWLREMHAEEGGPLPPALAREPRIPEPLLFYWNAFWDLSTDRPMTFGGAGAIPWSAIDRWADRHGVAGPESFARLLFLIRALDRVWLEDAEKRAKTPKAS